MKNKPFGLFRQPPFKIKGVLRGPGPECSLEALRDLAYQDYFANRANGAGGDDPIAIVASGPTYAATRCPKTGTYELIHGHAGRAGYVYGDRIGDELVCEMRYRPSPEVEAWMRARDENYIKRLKRSGELSRREPEVWAQLERERLATEGAEGKTMVGLASLVETLGLRGGAATKAIREADPSAVMAAVERIHAANTAAVAKR